LPFVVGATPSSTPAPQTALGHLLGRLVVDGDRPGAVVVGPPVAAGLLREPGEPARVTRGEGRQVPLGVLRPDLLGHRAELVPGLRHRQPELVEQVGAVVEHHRADVLRDGVGLAAERGQAPGAVGERALDLAGQAAEVCRHAVGDEDRQGLVLGVNQVRRVAGPVRGDDLGDQLLTLRLGAHRHLLGRVLLVPDGDDLVDAGGPGPERQLRRGVGITRRLGRGRLIVGAAAGKGTADRGGEAHTRYATKETAPVDRYPDRCTEALEPSGSGG
jgi:hypothetical protein